MLPAGAVADAKVDDDAGPAAPNAPAALPASPARPALTPAQPAIAALLKLGQVPSGPPFKLIDLHVDHLGSTRVTTDEQGTVVTLHDFFPFGEEIVPIPDDSTKLFTGHERDRETGLDYMLARYYSSPIGRFFGVDPVPGTAAQPLSWNRYTYGANNPMRYVDSDGRKIGDSAKQRTGEIVQTGSEEGANTVKEADEMEPTIEVKEHETALVRVEQPDGTTTDVEIESSSAQNFANGNIKEGNKAEVLAGKAEVTGSDTITVNVYHGSQGNGGPPQLDSMSRDQYAQTVVHHEVKEVHQVIENRNPSLSFKPDPHVVATLSTELFRRQAGYP